MPEVLLVPAYLAPQSMFSDVLALLAITGLANRAAPQVWLNASSESWVEGVPVMWPFPQADTIWWQYLRDMKNVTFDVAPNAELCSILSDPRVTSSVKGIVVYDDAEQLDGLQWAAASAAGIYDAVPVSSSMLTRHASCLAGLPTVFEIPPAAHFSGDNVAVYEWMLTELVPNASSTLIVGACHSWANYSCGWGDPLGTAAIDFAVSKRAMVVNLSPERAVNPRQAAAFSNIVAKMDQGFTFSGWAEPESDMVALLSAGGGVVLCGAPNLSFLSSMQVDASRLPLHRSALDSSASLDPNHIYLAFQSNEGDTPKNAYSFRGGNWILSRNNTQSPYNRSQDGRASYGQLANSVAPPIAWGSAPLIGELFPALWEYYVLTSEDHDQFFSACAGAGYAYPWSLPNPDAYFARVAILNAKFMPTGTDMTWVDVWEGACPTVVATTVDDQDEMFARTRRNTHLASVNPCLPMYERFRNVTLAGKGAVGGFSQQPSTPIAAENPHYVENTWLPDGTPVFLPPAALWYPSDKGFCNATDGNHGVRPSKKSLEEEFNCIEAHLRQVAASNPARPLFVLAYGVENYVDVAREMAIRLVGEPASLSEWAIIGAQDLAALGRAAAPSADEMAEVAKTKYR